MKRIKELVLIALLLIGGFSFLFDSFIVKTIALLRMNLLDELFLGVTFVSTGIIILFFLTSLFLFEKKKRKWILPLWLSLSFSVVTAFILKFLFHRLRPYEQGVATTLDFLQNANHLTWNFSFPSSHAIIVFCAIPILSKEFPKFKKFWWGFAILVIFSRIYFGLHFLSDVIFGSIIGYLIGLLGIKLKEKYFN